MTIIYQDAVFCKVNETFVILSIIIWKIDRKLKELTFDY